MRGFGHLTFADAADVVKALEKDGAELAGRQLRVNRANSRPRSGERTPQQGGRGGGGGGGDEENLTVFVKGFDRSLGEDQVRADLEAVFGEYGTVTRVSLPNDRESGELKGFGFVDFDSSEAKVRSFPSQPPETRGERVMETQSQKEKNVAGENRSGSRFVAQALGKAPWKVGKLPQEKAGAADGTEAAGGYLVVSTQNRRDSGGRGGRSGGRSGGRGGSFGGRGGFSGGRGGRGFGGRDSGGRGRGGRFGDRGGRGGRSGGRDFKPKMRIDPGGSASGESKKLKFDD